MPTVRRPVFRIAGMPPVVIPSLVSAWFCLLGIGWLVATPPGSGPDERAHLIKAIGVGRGQWAGEKTAAPTKEDLDRLFRLDPGAVSELNRARQGPSVRWQQRTRRDFQVPPALIDPRFGCTAGRTDVTGACLHDPSPPNHQRVLSSYVGTYQPYLYVLPGLAVRAAESPSSAIWLGRLAVLIPSLALLVAAVFLVWTPSAPGISLLGLALAVTPMVLFLTSMLSPSGLEIAAAVCFVAALARLVRGQPPPSFLWVALGASGAVLAAARALGPAFDIVLLVGVALLAGPRVMVRALQSGGARAAIAGAVVLIAAAASAAWEFTVQPRPSPSRGGMLDAIGPSVRHLPEVGEHAIGVFGKLDAPMPAWGHAMWTALLLALLAAALAAGGPRDRLVIGGLLGGVVAVVLGMSVIYREIGPLQGRYALPVLVLLPLWLSEVVLRRRERLPRGEQRALVAAVFLGTLVVNLLGLWALSRRFAVGSGGRWRFFGDAAWSPPLGWWPWVLSAVAAAAAYFAAGACAVVLSGAVAPRRRNTSYGPKRRTAA